MNKLMQFWTTFVHIEWCMYISCQTWYCLTCAEDDGVLDADDYLTCAQCL